MSLTEQFLAWVADRPRTYAEAMEAWRSSCPRLSIWEDAPLPKLPDLYCAILVRDGGDRTVIEELADYLKGEITLEPSV